MAWRHRLAAAAAAVTSLALLTGLALFLSTRDVRPVFLAVLAVAAAIEWLAYRERWTALRWPAAVVVDLVGVMLRDPSSRAEGWPEQYVPVPALAPRSRCSRCPCCTSRAWPPEPCCGRCR